MELKEGYKKTDVGIIPNEWTPKTYGELFHFLTTSSFSRDELSEEGDVRCVHYGDIHTKYHQFIDFKYDFKSFIDAENGKKYPFIKDGDIIMADASEDYSGIGKSVEVKNLGDKPAISGLHTFLLRDKNNDFVDGFRAYIHSMIPVKKSFDRLATGLKVYGVSKGNLKTVLVPVPPPEEQQAIATALSDVDTLITKLDKLIAKKKAIKQGAMQRLLKSPAQGGQRLPGFEGEWREKSLEELTIVQTGSTPPTSDQSNYGTDYLFVSPTDLGKEAFIRKTEKGLSKKGFEMSRAFPKNSVLFVCIGSTIGKTGIASEELTSNQQINAVFPSNELHYLFAYYLLTYYSSGIKALAGEQAVPQINKSQFEATRLFVPCFEEQQAIASILSDMDKEIESLETKKSKYLRIKKGMMQELLTGKTRLV